MAARLNALLAVLACALASELPQPEVEFDDGTTSSMILTKPESQKELVVLGCGLNAAPRLCGMALDIEAGKASASANAAAIGTNTQLIDNLQTSIDTLRAATLAEDKALRATSNQLEVRGSLHA